MVVEVIVEGGDGNDDDEKGNGCVTCCNLAQKIFHHNINCNM